MLRTLRYEKVGTRDMEGVVSKQEKAKQSGGRYKRRGELLETLFAEKIEDSLRKEVKRRRRRNLERGKLEERLGGPKSRKARNAISKIKHEVDKHRDLCKTNHKEKVEHLKAIYGDRIEKDRTVELPNHLSQYGGVKVFVEGCELLCEELKGPVVIEREGAPVTLSCGERALLTLGPGFCVYEKSDEEKFVTNVEISFLKYKWDKMSDTVKEPYVKAGKDRIGSDTLPSPVQDQGPGKIPENTAKQDVQDEDARIEKEMKRIDDPGFSRASSKESKRTLVVPERSLGCF